MHVDLWHWSASWPALVCYALVAAAHLAGLLRMRAVAQLGRERRRQALAFQVGLLLALLALVSPIGYLSDVYIWVRALQFLLLAVVATGLMVLGAPWRPLRLALWRAGPDSHGDGPFTRLERGPSRQHWLLAKPAIAVIAANVAWLAWQLPAPYDAARHNSAIALGCHVTYLAAGLVFWLQLIGSQPLSQRSAPLRRLRLVVGTAVAFTILGMVLVFGSGVLYPAYAGAAHHVMTVLDDQQLSGAVFWMGMLPPLVVVAVALLTRWLGEEESAELSAGLDRLLTPRKDAWSARPGIR